MSLVQDAQGTLWIGTLDGLARFEGLEIETAPVSDASPAMGPTWSLARRSKGGIYAGATAGLHVYDGEGWTLLPTRWPVLSVAESGPSLFIADEQGGLWQRRERTWDPIVVANLGKSVAVAASDTGPVWAAGTSGVARLDANPPAVAFGGAPSSSPLTALAVDRSGRVWVGTVEGGIYYADPAATAWSRVANAGWEGGRIRCLAEDRHGRMWAGGSEGRVSFGKEREPWTSWGPANGLKTAGVMAILPDREGTVWFGFNGDGLQQWLGPSWSHRTAWAGESARTARAQVFGLAATSDGGFLAAGFSRGLWRWDGRRMHEYGRAEGLTEDTRHAVEPAPDTLWVGGRYGIFESKGGGRFRKTLDLDRGFVTGLFRSPEGLWHAATSVGGVFVNRGSWRPAEEINRELADLYVRGMTWRRNGELWVATMRGVTVFGEGGAQTIDHAREPAVPESVNCTLEVGEDEVWVAGMGGIGVRRAGAWTRLDLASGLPGKTIYSLARDEVGTIWAGGSAGLGRYREGRWSVYDASNGMLETECNLNGLLLVPDGSVLAGTMASLARFQADPRPEPLPPLLCFWRQTPALGPDGEVALPGRRALRLSWSAPWLRLETVEYRTRIMPLSKEWSAPQRHNEVAIENLGPGRFQLEVQARLEGSGDSGWTEPLRMTARIAPRWWETHAARAAGLLVLGLGVLGLVRLRTGRLRRRAAALQRGIDEGLANIKVLRGLLPICAACKKVRDDTGYWSQIESYIREHSEARFTHGVCPDCARELYPGYFPGPKE